MLTRCPAAEIAPPGLKGREAVILRNAFGFRSFINEEELKVFGRQFLTRCADAVQKSLQGMDRAPGVRGAAAYAENIAAPRDADIQNGLNLAEVGVKRPRQIGELCIARVSRKIPAAASLPFRLTSIS